MEFISKLDPPECELDVLMCPQLTSAEVCKSGVFWCWYLTGCFQQHRMFDRTNISRLEIGNKGREFMYETGLTTQHVASTIILEICSNAGVGKHSRDGKSDYQTSKIHT